MKKIISVFLVLTIVFILWYWYFPIKLAVTENDYEGEQYIICEKIKTTGFEWRVCNSTYDYTGLIILKGNIDDALNFEYPLEWGRNKFIMKGTFSSEEYDFHGEKCPIFIVDSWDIIYPVKRDTFSFFSPSYGITPADE